FVFVNQWPADLPARVVGTLDHPSISLSQRDHPLLQYLSLSAVAVTQAHEVALTERATVLASAATSRATQPLIFLIQQSERVALCLAFDVLQTDLPFRNAFPVLLRNAVAYLPAEQQSWVRDQYAVGDVIEATRPLPAGVEKVTVARL